MVRAVLANSHSLGGPATMEMVVPRAPKSYPCSPVTSIHQSPSEPILLGVTRACQNPPGLWGPGSPLPTFPCSVRFRC